jgi:hypothetical protein
VRLNFNLFHLIAFLFIYFSIEQCLNYFIQPHQCTIGFLSWERINHFPFIPYGKNSFGIRPVWYKSKDLERIKDVYRGTTVRCNVPL